jgi:hypothetical protein
MKEARWAVPMRTAAQLAVGMALALTAACGAASGGPVVFGVEYDVEAGRFTQIAFNGDLG